MHARYGKYRRNACRSDTFNKTVGYKVLISRQHSDGNTAVIIRQFIKYSVFNGFSEFQQTTVNRFFIRLDNFNGIIVIVADISAEKNTL